MKINDEIGSMAKNYLINYRLYSSKEMVQSFRKELSITPKWRFLKRISLKRSIEFWRTRK